jgi:hypothetical protein
MQKSYQRRFSVVIYAICEECSLSLDVSVSRRFFKGLSLWPQGLVYIPAICIQWKLKRPEKCKQRVMLVLNSMYCLVYEFWSYGGQSRGFLSVKVEYPLLIRPMLSHCLVNTVASFSQLHLLTRIAVALGWGGKSNR